MEDVFVCWGYEGGLTQHLTHDWKITLCGTEASHPAVYPICKTRCKKCRKLISGGIHELDRILFGNPIIKVYSSRNKYVIIEKF